jgi:hypothetical protein
VLGETQGNASLSVDMLGGWGNDGPFAFSMWIQQKTDPGDYFQYVLSTRSNATGYLINNTIDVFQPDQVHLSRNFFVDQEYDTVMASHASKSTIT